MSCPLFFHSSLQLGLEASIDRPVVRSLDTEVVLLDPAFRGVVSILITFAVAESFRSGIVAVTKVRRDRKDSFRSDVLQRGIDGQVAGV